MDVNKLICKIFGHRWEYKSDEFHMKYTWPHRDCSRCKIKQQFNPKDLQWQTYEGLYFQVIPPIINKVL